MNIHDLTRHLAEQAQIIRDLAAGIPTEQARWKPDEKSWSVLEVVNHLYDEEREDFRAHLDVILHGGDWQPIDPPGWVTARGYNLRDLEQSLEDFLTERHRSIDWLLALDAPDWEKALAAPWGVMRAGDMAASWLAHDLLHIRQLVELRWQLNRQSVQPYEVQYAGGW